MGLPARIAAGLRGPAGWGAAVVVVFGIALATPYLALPVGTATTNGTSMGADGMHVLVYADPVLTGVAVGDAVIYRGDDRFVHHRIVDETDRGYITKGDAVPRTDQSLGAPPVTRRDIVGVVLLDVPIDIVWWASAGLLVVWGAMRLRRRLSSDSHG